MWKISPKALDYLAKQQVKEITVDQPLIISGCCIPVSEPPKVRIGEVLRYTNNPDGKDNGNLYVTKHVEGIKVNIPSYLIGLEVTIDLTQFLQRKKLVIEGWNLV